MIPSISEHMHTWTAVFGFKLLDESHKRELRSVNMAVFPGVAMLQKFLVKGKPTDGEKTGEGSIPLEDHHHLTPNTRKSCPLDTSDGHGLKTGDDSTLYDDIMLSERSADVVPSLPDSVVPSNGPLSEVNKLDAISLSSLHPKDEHDGGTAGDLNQLDAVSLSSPSNRDRPEPGPVLDLKQPDAHEKESKLNEALEVSEPVVLPDLKADSLECDKTAAYPSVSACNPTTTGGSKDNANHVHVCTQNGVHEEIESHVNFVVPSEAVVKSVENCSLADGDGNNGCDVNGEVVSVELPCQSKDINGDEVPLSVSGTDGEETNPKLRSRAYNEMGGNTDQVNDVNCPVGSVLDSTPVESALQELEENNAA